MQPSLGIPVQVALLVMADIVVGLMVFGIPAMKYSYKAYILTTMIGLGLSIVALSAGLFAMNPTLVWMGITVVTATSLGIMLLGATQIGMWLGERL